MRGEGEPEAEEKEGRKGLRKARGERDTRAGFFRLSNLSFLTPELPSPRLAIPSEYP